MRFRRVTERARRLSEKKALRVVLGLGLAAVVMPTSAVLTRSFMVEVPSALRHREEAPPNSRRVISRDGEPLADLRLEGGRRHVRLDLEEFGDVLPAALLAAEDRWFYEHGGVDVAALARALAQSVAAGRVTGGASTITQQLARRSIQAPRTLGGKLEVMALALAIERTLSKEEILELYLNHVDFGPNIEGAEAASRHYFGRRARSLSLSQAAALASIPRGPTLYDPRRGLDRVVRRRDRVLDRMERTGLASRDQVRAAKAEPLVIAPPERLGLAPHFVRALSRRSASCAPEPTPIDEGAAVVHTTLDADLQLELEAASRRAVEASTTLGISAVSVVVLDNESGDVLSYVGSQDVTDAARLGENDGARALRQPGSTLKPFVYAAALERGLLEPSSILPDVELSFEAGEGDAFRPQNFDRTFHGPVRLREALGNSLNVPAAWIADALGPGAVLSSLRSHGFCSLTESPSHYGVGIALGAGEVTLLDLAAAYAMLARGGVSLTPRFITSVELADGTVVPRAVDEGQVVLDRDVALIVTDVLADRRARRAAFGEGTVFDFPFAVAAKTGTSKGFRDNLAIGFSTRVTVAVWAGNFDGSAMDHATGISGAGPLFREAMAAASRRYPGDDSFESPAGYEDREVCALSGKPPTSRCSHRTREWVAPGPSERCDVHRSVRVDPTNGLLAGPSCADAEERIVERHPPLFQRWAHDAHRPLAPDEVSPRCKGDVDRDAQVSPTGRVLYPEDGARFYLEEGRTARVRVRGAFSTSRGAAFLLDGRAVDAGDDGTMVLTLERGHHTLRALVNGAAVGESISFSVE